MGVVLTAATPHRHGLFWAQAASASVRMFHYLKAPTMLTQCCCPAQVNDLTESFKRSLAEMENLRQRTSRQIDNAQKFAIQVSTATDYCRPEMHCQIVHFRSVQWLFFATMLLCFYGL